MTVWGLYQMLAARSLAVVHVTIPDGPDGQDLDELGKLSDVASAVWHP